MKSPTNLPSQELLLKDVFEKQVIFYSLNDIKKSVPKINFKKIKLDKIKDIDNSFKKKNITRVLLDSELIKLKFPIKRITPEKSKTKPLRKKIEEDLKSEEDITFNLEAQVLKEEDVILSPSELSIPPLRQDVLSASGEQTSYVWPPNKQNDAKESSVGDLELKSLKKDKKKPKQAKKPYFLSKEKEKEEEEKPKLETKKYLTSQSFPWAAQEQEYESLETVFKGGLESELLDTPIVTEEKSKQIKEISVIKDKNKGIESEKQARADKLSMRKQLIDIPVFKAVNPQVDFELPSDFLSKIDFKKDKSDMPFTYDDSLNNTAEELLEAQRGKVKKVKKMSDKFRIILYGGLIVTVAYLVWSYYFPHLKIGLLGEENKSGKKVVVRDLFKQNYIYKKALGLQKEMTKGIEGAIELKDKLYKPITEKERLSLIQKAREALESRLDPFGQDFVLPPSVIEQKLKEKQEEKIPEIDLERKQIELVGVISTKERNLALVNIYTAIFVVNLEDDKLTRESKLKAALSMAVPARVEVSVLDPIEDWSVKQIVKSKSKSEDPTIELVKGNKKFKLKVGQKVLLPEEKTFEELKEALELKLTAKEKGKEAILE